MYSSCTAAQIPQLPVQDYVQQLYSSLDPIVTCVGLCTIVVQLPRSHSYLCRSMYSSCTAPQIPQLPVQDYVQQLYSCLDPIVTRVGLCTVVVQLPRSHSYLVGLCTVVVQLPRSHSYLCRIMYNSCTAPQIPQLPVQEYVQQLHSSLDPIVTCVGLCTVVVQLPRFHSYLCRIMYSSCTAPQITQFNLMFRINQKVFQLNVPGNSFQLVERIQSIRNNEKYLIKMQKHYQQF